MSHPTRPRSCPRSVQLRSTALGLALALGWVAALPGAATAQSTIRRPGLHPKYTLEAEPHLNLGLFNLPDGGDTGGIGAGFRATIPIVENGFVPTINNSVGISFGGDWLYTDVEPYCESRDSFTQACAEIQSDLNYLIFPAAMQWNFWLTKDWSVFGEPGVMLYWSERDTSASLTMYAGGRWHFSEAMSLTMRLGYPTSSVGVSFFL